MLSASRSPSTFPENENSFEGNLYWEYEMKFRPLHDRVVLRRIEDENKTAGGIIIPDTAAEKPQQGEIIAVGPGARADDGRCHCGWCRTLGT